MTRKQQIKQAWLHGDAENLTSFRMGAEWADEHPLNSWVRCKDKMPEKFEVVIAYAANGHIENSYWDGHCWTGDFYHTEVIYWMPMPTLTLF